MASAGEGKKNWNERRNQERGGGKPAHQRSGRKGHHVSTAGQKPTGVLFSSGLASDWLIAEPEIRKRFQAIFNAWEMLTAEERGPPPAEGQLGPLLEIAFREVAPTLEECLAHHTAELASNQEAYDAETVRLNGEEGALMGQAQRDAARTLAQNVFRKRRQDLQDRRIQYENQFHTRRERYERKEREYQTFIESIHKVFMTSFGGQAQAMIIDLIGQRRYREAWRKLKESYSVGAGGRSGIQSMMNKLADEVYRPQNESLTEFMERVRRVCNALAAAEGAPGGVATESKVINAVVNGINKNPSQKAAYAIPIGLYNSTTEPRPEEMWKMLHKRQQELESEFQDGKRKRFEAYAGTAGAKRPKTGEKKKCYHCGKPGHVEKDCWQKNPCSICNKTGHCAKFCKSGSDNGKNDMTAQGNTATASVGVPVTANKSQAYVVLCFDETHITELEYDMVRIPVGEDQHDVDIGPAIVREVTAAPDTRYKMTSPWYECDEFALVMEKCYIEPAKLNASSEASSRVILDSGATMHMFSNRRMMKTVRTAGGQIKLGTDNVDIPIRGIGNTNIHVVQKVLYAPELNTNIISISAIDALGYKTVFSSGVCTIISDYDKSILMTGYMANGLYYLDDLYVNCLYGDSYLYAFMNEHDIDFKITAGRETGKLKNVPVPEGEPEELKSTGPVSSNANAIAEDEDNINLDDEINWDEMYQDPDDEVNYYMGTTCVEDEHLHQVAARYTESEGINKMEIMHKLLGHMSEGMIKIALGKGLIKGAPYTLEELRGHEFRNCYECMRGRMKARPREPTSKDDWKTMEKIAIDYKGPFSIESYHKKKGVMLISDYESNFVYAYPVRTKGESLDALKDFNVNIVKKYNFKMKTLQSDADCIFKAKRIKNWLMKKEMTLQLSAPYMHYQNGQIERDVQNVFDKTRTLMLSYDVPPKFWEYAVDTACYLINRSPTTGREKTPWEAVTGQVPSVEHYVAFWTSGVYYVSKEERGKDPWEPRAHPCRFLGYSWFKDGTYHVYSLHSKKIITRGNCVFDPQKILEEDDYIPEREDLEIVSGHDDLEIFEDLRIEENQGEDSESDNDESEESMEVTAGEGYMVKAPVTDGKGYEYNQVEEEENEDPDPIVAFAGVTYWHSRLYNNVACMERWYIEILLAAGKVQPLPPNPINVEAAMKLPDADLWREAMRLQVAEFTSRELWRITEEDGRAMKTKWILTYKYDQDYNIKRKARLVVCGYSQIKGVDYHDTYSPTTTTEIIFFMLHLCSVFKWYTSSFDVSAAFLEGDAEEVLYARLPPGTLNDNKVPVRVEIRGNWYGEKQAGRIWNKKFDSIMKTLNMERCPMMPCLYKSKIEDDITYVIVHVDDGLMMSTREEFITAFMDQFKQYVTKVTYNTTFTQYLKLEISLMKDGRISVGQTEYIKGAFRQAYTKPATPMCTTMNLRVQQPNPRNESILPECGKIRFAVDRTRPDGLATAGEISSGGASTPSDEHVKAKNRLIDYLQTTREVRLILGGTDPICLFGYADAAYVTDGNARSRLGGCLFLGTNSGAFRSWSRNETATSTICHSSTEAEIKAMDEICKEVLYWLEVLKFTEVAQQLPVKIYVDNKSAIELCRVMKTTHLLKHINRRIMFINELIETGIVEFIFIPGKYNVSDILTKGLPRGDHGRHANILLHGHSGMGMNKMFAEARPMRAYVTTEDL